MPSQCPYIKDCRFTFNVLSSLPKELLHPDQLTGFRDILSLHSVYDRGYMIHYILCFFNQTSPFPPRQNYIYLNSGTRTETGNYVESYN